MYNHQIESKLRLLNIREHDPLHRAQMSRSHHFERLMKGVRSLEGNNVEFARVIEVYEAICEGRVNDAYEKIQGGKTLTVKFREETLSHIAISLASLDSIHPQKHYKPSPMSRSRSER